MINFKKFWGFKQLATQAQLVSMLRYLDRDSVPVPHFKLELPAIIQDERNWRPNMRFYICKNGCFRYVGVFDGETEQERRTRAIGQLKFPQPWIDRAYEYVSARCEEKMMEKVRASNIKNVRVLLCKFNNLDFMIGEL